MIAIVSPAKTLDFETQPCTEMFSEPGFLEDSEVLVKHLRKFSVGDLGHLMGISSKLAELNHGRFRDWSTPFNTVNSKPAVLAFQGDVYTGLQASDFSEDDFTYAQDHFRILSGLYGMLRPLDLIQPYRLEMGTRLANPRGKDLYSFWDDRITDALAKDLAGDSSGILVNLASNEYFNSIQTKKLGARVVTPVFQDEKNGQYKIISFFAKKARGLMTRYIIQERVESPRCLKDFTLGGYVYNESSSNGDRMVFMRSEAAREK